MDVTTHYKDCSPELTVSRIQDILRDVELDLEEHWQEPSVIGTYAMRLTVRDTDIGTNGKGMSEAYCRASAYAEFMERLQNGLLGDTISIARLSRDQPTVPFDKLVQDPDPVTAELSRRMGLSTLPPAERTEGIRNLLFPMGTDSENPDVPVSKFTIVGAEKPAWVPTTLRRIVYGSNGMCAGNTRSEALVQGLAEICERRAQRSLLLDPKPLPVIPAAYIARFPALSSRLEQLRAREPQLTVELLDCTQDQPMPVVGLLVAKRGSNKFGLKLGAHPDMAIALERAMTESTQGQDLGEYAQRSSLSFTNDGVSTSQNVTNTYKTGHGACPYQLWQREDAPVFRPPVDPPSDNDQQLASLLEHFREAEKPVLIHDASILGFPTFQIVIPGISEMYDLDPLSLRARNSRMWFIRNLKNGLSDLSPDDARLMVGTLDYYSGALLESSLGTYISAAWGDIDPASAPLARWGLDRALFKILCTLIAGDLEASLRQLTALTAQLPPDIETQPSAPYVEALRLLVEAATQGIEAPAAAAYLTPFFDQATLDDAVRTATEPAAALRHMFSHDSLAPRPEAARRGAERVCHVFSEAHREQLRSPRFAIEDTKGGETQ